MPRMKLKSAYKKLGKKSSKEIVDLVYTIMEDTVPMLEGHDQEMIDSLAEYIFMIAGVDEKVHMNEYCLIKPLMSAAVGKDCSYAEAEKFISENGLDEDETRDRFRDVLNELSITDPELRYNMITLAMYISAIDDDVSQKEKEFIESLL